MINKSRWQMVVPILQAAFLRRRLPANYYSLSTCGWRRASIVPVPETPIRAVLRHQEPGTGLVGAGASDDFYSSSLDLEAAAELLDDGSAFWAAVEADAAAGALSTDAYLRKIRSSAHVSTGSGKLLGLYHNDVLSTLRDTVVDDRGQMVQLLGGARGGKSNMLRSLATELAAAGRTVIIVSGRQFGADLNAGLAEGLVSVPGFLDSLKSAVPGVANAGAAILSGLHGVAKSASAFAHVPVVGAGAAVVSALAREFGGAKERSLHVIVRALVESCKGKACPIIIIDDTDRVLPSATAAAAGDSFDALSLLAMAATELRQANLLLVSSSLSEPQRLARLGFDAGGLTQTVLATELPPAHMRALLRAEWGAGPRLAEALLAAYGGHVWTAQNAVASLCRRRAAFKPLHAHSARALLEVEQLRHEFSNRVLVGIARDGYCRTADVPSALDERLAGTRALGVVPASAVAPGVPAAAWARGCSHVFVPANHATRLLLARVYSPTYQ